MSLTKIGSIGINTGIQLAGVTTVAEFHVGAGSSVGIGTIAPDTPLHIRTSDTQKFITLSGGTKRNNYFGLKDADNLEIAADEDDEGPSSSIRFRIDGSEVARIHHAGRLGIGTNNPLAELHLSADNPNIEFNDVNTLSNAEITLDNTQFRIECDEDNAVDSSAIKFRIDGSDQVSINSSGDLIIKDKIVHHGDTNTSIRFPDDDQVSVETGGSERVRINANGKVLINHSSARGIGGSQFRQLQIEGTSAGDSSASLVRNSADVSPPNLSFGKSRATSVGGTTIVQDGDALGNITFSGADGTDLQTNGAVIRAEVDGTPGANDMPGRLIFKTTPDGAAQSTEKLRITSAGKILVGDTTARDFDDGNTPQLQVASNTSGEWARMSSATYIDSAIGGGIILAHSRNATIGSHTVLANGDKLGSIFFEGSDGTQFARGAQIQAFVDGTPGTNDMPGRIEFSTSNDGSSSPTVRATFNSSGSFIIGGTSSSIDVASGSAARLQVKHTTGNISAAFYSTANASGPAGILALGHARSTVSGALQEDDVMGEIRFAGGDGTDLESVGASIKGVVNATPGSNDMPGAIRFGTTADGAASPTDHWQINRSGVLDALNSGAMIRFLHGHTVTANDATVVNNTLNDYEEGELDWEIHKADYLTTGSNTAGSKVTYQKIGSMVHVQGYIRTDGTSPSGISNKAAILTDASGNRAQLPFTPSHPGAFIVTHLRSFNDHDDSTFAIGWTINNDDLYVHKVLSNEYVPTSDNATTTNQTNLVICFTGHYHTND